MDAMLMIAHAAGDKHALVDYYAGAADFREAAGDIDATCFFLTHAYVFALDCGSPMAPNLHARLLKYGREE